ncbi:MAG: LLM class F420-dependent oxidoreductase [Actinobacteria bacterium ATB1]|nr:LLM class F420-dependent oxidoreductase [Actinobacteria bacterium ATB1]
MRYSLGLPTDRVSAPAEFVTGAAVMEVARAAETAGFDACFVTDHPFPPTRWLESGGHHALDPFVALSFAAAATERLLLQTNMYVVPYRNPFLGAKAVASLDALSGGRVVLGIAAGYLKGEFAALGAAFEDRNARTDEAIAAMRAAWTGRPIQLAGRDFEARDNVMLPAPVAGSSVPIWIGGNSRRAMRRAVEVGDGWVPFPTPPGTSGALRTGRIESLDDLEARIGILREMEQEAERDTALDICFVPFGLNMMDGGSWTATEFREAVTSLGEFGVTWLTLTLPGRSRAELLREIERFGSEIIRGRWVPGAPE